MNNNNKAPAGGLARRALYVLAALAAMSAIFWFSTGAFSSDATRRLFGEYNFLARKAAHVCEFAGLFLVLRFASSRFFRSRTNRLHAPLAFLMAAGYAVFDEWHQSFVPDRSASATDVVIDIAGVFIGFALWLAVHIVSSRRDNRFRTQS